MGSRVLFSAPDEHFAIWRPHLLAAFAAADLDVVLTDDPAGPWTFDYLIYCPGGPVADFSPFTRLKAVLSLWAGVERIVGEPTLTVPLCRMVDEGLARGMIEYVTGHVLRYHLGMDAYILGMASWRRREAPPLARDRTVGVLGLGELGGAVALTLAGLGFDVRGWSRRARDVPGIACHSGEAGLEAVLRASEILVTLLPATPATESLLDARRLALLPAGAVLINPGRGTLIDDDALIEALDGGRLAHATLDVFRKEPLPSRHPFRDHKQVTVTPHIASETRPETASDAIALNIRRGEEGAPFLHVVDREFWLLTGRGRIGQDQVVMDRLERQRLDPDRPGKRPVERYDDQQAGEDQHREGPGHHHLRNEILRPEEEGEAEGDAGPQEQREPDDARHDALGHHDPAAARIGQLVDLVEGFL